MLNTSSKGAVRSRTLLGPGPSDVHPRVLEAMARPTIGHLDPLFLDMMDEIKSLLQYAFRTRNELTIPISAPGSAGMETCFVNLVNPGDKVVVCRNGVFGDRMQQIVVRCMGVPIVVDQPWGEAVDPDLLDHTLRQHPDATLVAFVHAETSTGALSDAKTLVEVAHQHGCLTIVDAVTSLGGSPVEVDEWQIDAIYSGTQQCLSAPPGLSPISMSSAAIERIASRKLPVQSWFMDLRLIMDYWQGDAQRAYHHTAPVNSLYALHEALRMLKEEGIENSWQRHRDNYKLLAAGLEELGLHFLVNEPDRLPQLSSVLVNGVADEARIRRTLLSEHNIEIGGGLGEFAGRVWRIGLMGQSSQPDKVRQLLKALGHQIANNRT